MHLKTGAEPSPLLPRPQWSVPLLAIGLPLLIIAALSLLLRRPAEGARLLQPAAAACGCARLLACRTCCSCCRGAMRLHRALAAAAARCWGVLRLNRALAAAAARGTRVASTLLVLMITSSQYTMHNHTTELHKLLLGLVMSVLVTGCITNLLKARPPVQAQLLDFITP